jgi:hypothetical protein
MKRKKPTVKKATRKVARKPGSKKPQKHNILNMAAEVEKEFFNLPAKLVALCRRETAALKQTENKLKATLKTATAKQAMAAKRFAALKKGKKAPTRKQLSTVRKLITAGNRQVTEAKRNLKLHLQNSEAVSKKQAGFTLLTRELPKLRRSMQTAGRKTVKKPAKRKIRSSQRSTGYNNKSHDNYQPSFPVLSTRVDTSEIT